MEAEIRPPHPPDSLSLSLDHHALPPRNLKDRPPIPALPFLLPTRNRLDPIIGKKCCVPEPHHRVEVPPAVELPSDDNKSMSLYWSASPLAKDPKRTALLAWMPTAGSAARYRLTVFTSVLSTTALSPLPSGVAVLHERGRSPPAASPGSDLPVDVHRTAARTAPAHRRASSPQVAPTEPDCECEVEHPALHAPREP